MIHNMWPRMLLVVCDVCVLILMGGWHPLVFSRSILCLLRGNGYV